jgi:1,4-alpha-glucan branching enzyme
LKKWVSDLNHLYIEEPAMHEFDCDARGMQWIDCSDSEHSVVSFIRKGANPADKPVVFIFNYTPVPRPGYRVGLPWAGFWKERMNSDAEIYGGSGLGNYGGREAIWEGWQGQPASVQLDLPPLGVLVLVPDSVPEPPDDEIVE